MTKRKRAYAPRPKADRNRTEIGPGLMPLTKELLLLTRAHGDTDNVQRRAGYDTKTLASWARGRQSPTLRAFVDIANTVGYDVVLVPLDATASRPVTPEEQEAFDFDA